MKSISVAGVIGFLALIVPHLARRLVGNNHWLLAPFCMVLGGFTLLLADTGFSSRTGLLSLDPDYYYRLLDLSGLPEDAVLPAGLSGRSLILDMNPGQDPAELTGFTCVCVGGKDLSRQVEWESALSSKLRWLSHDEALELCADQELRLSLWPWMTEG